MVTIALTTVVLASLASDASTARASDGPASPRRIEIRDAGALMKELDGTIVVESRTRTLVHNPTRAHTRFVPASTYKIPNMLIALETGIASNDEFLLPWNGERPATGFWRESWSRDHTLRTAIQNGVLWYFQEIARRVGKEQMVSFVRRFDYGNRDVRGAIDRFWLDGPLQISALEQVQFVRRFYESDFGLSAHTMRIARDVLVLERNADYTLSGKTGTAPLPSGRMVSWFVGYVEGADDVMFFALNLDCPDFETCDHAMRRRMTLAILAAWDLLPKRQAPE